jgi:SAM-dependent methyltransferase
MKGLERRHFMNPWNQLADEFGHKRDDEEIPEYAADNVCIAYPSIIRCIQNRFNQPLGKKALDFGCGGGLFCEELLAMGFEVTGYDSSEALVKAARMNTSKKVNITDSWAIASQSRYDLIASVMVLQFIEDIERTIADITSLIQPNGLVIYAVFNPNFIEDNLNGSIFSGFQSRSTGYMELKEGIKVKCHSRNNSEYHSLFKALGYEEVYLDYPEFTGEFLQQFKVPFATRYSEYLIQAFKRNDA